MMPREFPATRQSDFSSHEPLPRTPSDLLQPLECPFRPRKDWHANRDEPHGNRNQVREPRKSERVKIESFVLCPTFLVPRNAKNLPELAEILVGKLPSNGPKTLRWPLSRGHISQAQARIPANPEPCKSRQRKLSDDTKNVEIQHRELGQKHARTGTRFEKERAGSKMRFSSRTAAFARRVFPTRNKLIFEPG